MIEQPGGHDAADPSSVDHTARSSADDQASELAQALERLSFYESFDSLIRDNVLRSGELLRQVAAERERTDQRLRAMQSQLDQRLAEHRSMLADIASGLSGLQDSLSGLVDRVNTSILDLDSLPEVAALGEVAGTGASEDRDWSGGGEPAVGALVIDDGDGLNEPAATLPPVERGQHPAGLAVPGEEAGSRDDIEPSVPVRRTIDVIVHGVPRAATALSLQRHLEDLQGVETVEVREYVSGILRFQMVATEFEPDDLRQWSGADALQTLTSRDNVLELRLVAADSP